MTPAFLVLALASPVAPAAVPPPIRLVVIDRATQERYGPLPWPRDRIAQMVGLLTEARARAVVLRFYFRDARGDAGDRALVRETARHGHVFVEMGRTAAPPGWEPDAAWLDRMALRAEGSPPKRSVEEEHVQLPFRELADVVRGVGSVDVIVDGEGRLRSLPLVVRHRGRAFPSLALRVFLDAAGLEGEPLRFEPVTETRFMVFDVERGARFNIGQRRLALDALGCRFVNLTAPGAYRPVSFADVIEGKVPAKTFRDTVVLVGAAAPELDVQTSTGSKSGLELVADQLAGLFATAGRE